MPKTFETLSLQDAKRMLAAGEAKANQIGIPYNIGVVDGGGRLLAFSRQDGALIGSIDLALQKAFTAQQIRVMDRRSFLKSSAALSISVCAPTLLELISKRIGVKCTCWSACCDRAIKIYF
jgi:uncharacterized protein GlcG (DUF336 family)